MYQAQLGRFLSRDPLPQDGEPDILFGDEWVRDRLQSDDSILSRNLYAYTTNPISFVDPSGMLECHATCGSNPCIKDKPRKICWQPATNYNDCLTCCVPCLKDGDKLHCIECCAQCALRYRRNPNGPEGKVCATACNAFVRATPDTACSPSHTNSRCGSC